MKYLVINTIKEGYSNKFNNMKSFFIIEKVQNDHIFKSFESLKNKDIYRNIFNTLNDANKFIKNNK